jgi:hypothetical protein
MAGQNVVGGGTAPAASGARARQQGEGRSGVEAGGQLPPVTS